ncbi:MAG: DUF3829 domain-containing protein [Bacteroidia bacterium]|nr:DUF3829 domain-containing protein [Bacteroidia bacterium]
MAKQQDSFLKNLFLFVVVLGAVYMFSKSEKGRTFIEERFTHDEPAESEVVEAEPSVPVIEISRHDLARKLSRITQCLNRQSDRAFSSYERYLSWADSAKGPDGSGTVYGLYTIYEISSCQEALKESREEYPPLSTAFEAAVDSFETALIRLYPTLERANRYYDHEDYRDDNFEKARQMHKPLMEAYGRYARADREIRRQLEPMVDSLLLLDFQELDSAENKGAYHVYANVITAGHILRLVSVPMLSRTESPRLDSMIQRFQSDVEQWEQEAQAGDDPDRYFQSLGNNAFEFLKAAKMMARRLRESKGAGINNLDVPAYSYYDSNVEALTDRYNDLVSYFNGLELPGDQAEIPQVMIFHTLNPR